MAKVKDQAEETLPEETTEQPVEAPPKAAKKVAEPEVKTIQPPTIQMLIAGLRFVASRTLDAPTLKAFKEALPEVWQE